MFRMTHGFGEFSGNAAGTQSKETNANIFWLFFLFFLLGLQLVVGVWWLIDRLLFSTTIMVDRDWVRVGRQFMRRSEFGDFLVHHTLARGQKRVAVLGYAYHNRRYAFGGVWPLAKAEEVASALNGLLHELPTARDRRHPSPDDLRTRRPTRF